MNDVETPLSQPDVRLDPYQRYRAKFRTNRGTFDFDLFSKESPVLVNNFIFLAVRGYYDGTKFHRVIEGYVVQGGDRTGSGEGGPGYYVPDELGKHRHTFGVLSMSNCGPNTNGSQFFVMLADAPWLDATYSAIGKLVSGENVVPQIVQGDQLIGVSIYNADAPHQKPLSWNIIVSHWLKVMGIKETKKGDSTP